MKRTIVIIAMAALALAGCGTGVPTKPVSAPSPTSTPYSFVDPNIPNADYSPSDGGDTSSDGGSDYSSGSMPGSLQETVLDDLWSNMDFSTRDQICTGWRMNSSLMLDKFMEGASGSYDRATVRAFFNGKC